MTKEEAYRYIDNLKRLKGYGNTKIGGKTVDEMLDEIEALLKEQEVKQQFDIDIPLKERNDNFDLYDTPIFGFHD